MNKLRPIKTNTVASRIVEPASLFESAKASRLFAVLDACDEPAVLAKASVLGDMAPSLYRGNAACEFSGIAPYLFQIDTSTLEWVESELFGKHFGIFLESSVGLEKLRSHLRRFLLVRDDENKSMYFRFYDPRVLANFLVCAPGTDAVHFFGEVNSFYAFDADSQLVRFELQQSSRISSRPRQLTVSKKLIDDMAAESKRKFSDRLCLHLTRFVAETNGAAAPGEVPAIVDAGINKAATYEITSEKDTAKYVEVLCHYPNVLGAEQDPLPARNILHDRRHDIQTRIEQLSIWAQNAQTREVN